ncbi:protein of unknown function [uncultured Woeseiaceae bacterium]|uniref:SAF domain-containing protein n=1 Tax=uncultured Woeseiaceae bacterium TaxID=1983305 RepID=A0A7D9D2F0_9GAMM|nr:protein of unknown function [uncultured Woeseiaceae bacterium]
MGSADLNLSNKELEYRNRAGKVAVASRSLKRGTKLSAADIELKRVSLDGVPSTFKTRNEILNRSLLLLIFIKMSRLT